jgi:hypothetical protein
MCRIKIRIDDDVAGVGDAERVAVGRGLGDRVHGDIAARARTVLDHHRLAALGGEVGAEDARGEIGDPAGRGRDDDLERLDRVALGEGGRTRDGNEDQDRKRADHVRASGRMALKGSILILASGTTKTNRSAFGRYLNLPRLTKGEDGNGCHGLWMRMTTTPAPI